MHMQVVNCVAVEVGLAEGVAKTAVAEVCSCSSPHELLVPISCEDPTLTRPTHVSQVALVYCEALRRRLAPPIPMPRSASACAARSH